MSEIQMIYTREQIELIEQQLDRQMEQQCNSQISVCLQERLRKLCGTVQYDYFLAKMGLKKQQIPEEIVICAFFSYSRSLHQSEKIMLTTKKQQLEQQLSEAKQSLLDFREQVKCLNKRIGQLQGQAINFEKQNIKKSHEIYLMNQIIIKSKQQINNLRNVLFEMQATSLSKEANLREQISELFSLVQKLKLEIQNLNTQNVKLQCELKEIENILIDEYQKRKINLVTFNIEADQINEKYIQYKDYFQKFYQNTKENRLLVGVINKLKQNFDNFTFSQLNATFSQLQIPYEFYSTIFQNKGQSQRIIVFLQSFKQILQNISKRHRQLKQSCKENLKILEQLQIRNQTLVKENKMKQMKLQKLQQSVHHLTESNYKMLLEFQQRKQKLQNGLVTENKRVSVLTEEINKLRQQNTLFSDKINNIEYQLNMKTQRNIQYQLKIKQNELKYKQLQDFFLTFRESIKNAVEFDKDDISNIKLIEHLVDKNAELMKNMTVILTEMSEIKQSLSLKQCQLQNINKKLIQKSETAEYAIQTNKVLKIQNEKLELMIKQFEKMHLQLQKQLKKKQTSLNLINSQLLQIKSSQSKQLNKKLQYGAQTQFLSIRQSQIRKQNIQSSSVNRMIEKEKNEEQNQKVLKQIQKQKQNLNPKLKIKGNNVQCKGYPCSHLQKISSLNEIINYLMNYLKGYKGNYIRDESWLSNQINRYGQGYEQKIMNQNNFEIKLKNMKVIEELCHRQPSCGKLINEFEVIMQYYFEIISSIRSKSFSETVSKSNLSRTINKYGNIQKTRGSISRIYG